MLSLVLKIIFLVKSIIGCIFSLTQNYLNSMRVVGTTEKGVGIQGAGAALDYDCSCEEFVWVRLPSMYKIWRLLF